MPEAKKSYHVLMPLAQAKVSTIRPDDYLDCTKTRILIMHLRFTKSLRSLLEFEDKDTGHSIIHMAIQRKKPEALQVLL